MTRISFDDSQIASKLHSFPTQADRALRGVVRFHRPSVETDAKNSAPWTDRTSNARNGLFAKTVIEPRKRYAIVLAHSVPYGIWLEVRWSGRYAVIRPTIIRNSRLVMQTASRLFDTVFR